MSKFLFSFTIILGSLLAGYTLQQLSTRQILKLPLTLTDLRTFLQQGAMLWVVPITVVGAVWIIRVQTTLTLFPLLGLGAYLLGGGLAIGVARVLNMPPLQAGAFFTCGYFANVVSIGGVVCYLFLGEQGFALVSLYKLLEPLSYYVIGFSIAKSYSLQTTGKIPLADRVKQLAKDPFILVGTSSLTLGALFNVSGLARPAIFATLNAVLIPLGTVMLLVSIGLTLQFTKITVYLRECVIIGVIKFVLVPLCISLAAYLIGYGTLAQGLPLHVIIILASMPVAFNAVVATSIYDLDVDLTNSCFLLTTAALVVVLPLLYYVISLV